jgi:hypothetical protein
MNRYVFILILVATCAYALWRGDRDSRLVALISLAATVLTHIAISPTAHRYSNVEAGVFLVDLATLGGFVAVALISDRFWPLWVAGLQLTTELAHVLKGISASLVPEAYAAAGRMWSYPILFILAVGTWRSYRRRARVAGGVPA